jgi:hypothetical protein
VPQLMRTSLSRRWVIKMSLVTAGLVAFGTWGLWDALVKYPQRGQRHADHCRLEYLRSADASGQISRHSLTVADPAMEMSRLQERRRTPGAPALTDLEQSRLTWLTALSRIGRLREAETAFAGPDAPDPRDQLAELERRTAGRATPKPLSTYDIPAQWAFVGIGYGGGLAMIALFLSVARRTYEWDPVEQRLVLPGGESLVPADLAEVDKRKWDKFYVFLVVGPRHARLGGKAVRLDLYRHVPLEDWVMTMERTAFPEPPDDADASPAGAPIPPDAPGGSAAAESPGE